MYWPKIGDTQVMTHKRITAPSQHISGSDSDWREVESNQNLICSLCFLEIFNSLSVIVLTFCSAMPICNIILYMYIVHSSAMQAAAKIVVINMTFVCHGQDCNSILLGPATSGANELIVFRSHSVCNFQFKIGPPGNELTYKCILCYAVRIRLLKLLATRKRMKDTKTWWKH